MATHCLLAIAACFAQALSANPAPKASADEVGPGRNLSSVAGLGVSVAPGQRVRIRTVSHTPPVVIRPSSFELPVNQYTPRILALLSAFPVQGIAVDADGRPNRVVLNGAIPEGLLEAARNGPVTLDWVQLDEHGNTIAYQLATRSIPVACALDFIFIGNPPRPVYFCKNNNCGSPLQCVLEVVIDPDTGARSLNCYCE